MSVDDERWYADNRDWWDEKVPLHVGGEFYRVDAFKAGEEQLRPFELAEVGDVAGRTLFHPQCHFGQDTLSWARHGATVTGLDFSPAAVAAATRLAAEVGIDARFVCADVYDAPDAVGGERFDVVYTGLGAVNWLHDIERWAATMAAVCRPGGTFYLAEFHPVAATFDDETTEAALVPRYGYFGHEWHDTADTFTGSYGAEDAATEFNDTHERVWTLGEVVTAIAGAGFRIEFLHEWEYTLYRSLPFVVRTDRGYELPDGLPRIPMMYSLRATRI